MSLYKRLHNVQGAPETGAPRRDPVMDELRQRIGDDRFWSLVRAWPAERSGDNADYADITTWWSEQTGEDLTSFFDAWLLGKKTPPRT